MRQFAGNSRMGRKFARRTAIYAGACAAISIPNLSRGTPTVQTLSDSHGQYYLVNNGSLQFQLYTTGALAGKITSIIYNGQQMVGSKDLYYDIQGTPNIYLGSGETYAVRTGSNFVDLSAEHPATTTEPLDVTWHWILEDGQSGFSTYLTYHHTTAMADYASSENRLGAEFFNDSLFHYSSITDNFWGYQAAGDADRNQGRFITGETSDMRGIPSEYTKNYETKYDWRSTYAQSGGVTGIFGAPNTTTSTKPLLANDYGVWSIENYRSYESWNAGPTHPQTPVADGASIIPSPPGSHFGGPDLTYIGNMDKSFGPIFTYFNKGSNITALRADATQYTTSNTSSPYDLNNFYDSLNLPYYTTTSQRGTVDGTMRLADGSSMAGATIVLSAFDPTSYTTDPIGQEYQRRAAGYNYWVTPNNDGTFTLPDVIPGTYRITVIKPGNYREGTFDNINVTAGNTTNVGRLTWQPDISGKGVFQIGTFDRTAGEFRDGANYNNWIDTFNQTKEFPNGVNYTVNPANPFNDTQNWSQNWPLDQINGTLDFFNVNFNLASAPAANSTVTVTLSIASQEFINDFAVLVGSNRVDASFDHTSDNAPSVVRSGDTSSRVLYRKLTFPGSWLVAGNNAVTFHIIGGEMQYDAVRMDIQNPGTFSDSIWNGGTGNWSDATQWGTQQYGYTAVNKGAATINGVANSNYPNDTSTTFADSAANIAPINNTSSQLYYDADINGGTVTLNTTAAVQKLSLLAGTVNVSNGTPTLTVNDAFVLGGGNFNGTGTINALTTTAVNFANTISGGAKINSTGAVTWTDGGTSVTVTDPGSQWTTPGLSLGQTDISTLTIANGALVSTGAGMLIVGPQGTVSNTAGTLNTSGISNAGTFTSTGTVALGTAGSFTNTGTATISGGLSGLSVINNAGTLILSGSSTYTGPTTINGGAVQFTSAASIGGSGASVVVNPGGGVSYSPGVTNSTFLSRLSALSSGAFALTTTDSVTTLDFTSAPLSPFAAMSIGALGSVTYTGTYTPANGIYRLGGGGGTLTYSPPITGSSSLVIGNTGSSGTVIVNSANSFTGPVTLKGAVLSVPSLANGGASSPLGSSSNAAANLTIDGGTLQATATASTDRLFTLGSGGATLIGDGPLSFTNTGSIASTGSGNRTLILAGASTANVLSPALTDPASGTTSLTKTGSGTWTLNSSSHTYSGDTTVLAGTLKLGTGALLPTGAGKGNLDIATAATFDIAGNSITINGLNDGPPGPITSTNTNGWATPNGPGGGTLLNSIGTQSLTIGNNNAAGLFSGIIAGSINLIKVGSGTQILSGDNTYLGTTTITSGTIQLGIGGVPSSFGPGDGGFRGQFGSGNIINNATLVFNRGYLTTCTNTISGTGTLKQTANAELALGSANTYTGPTIIGQGIANIGLGGPTDGTGLAYSGDCSLNASVLANGGLASSIGASSNIVSNLILDGGTLYYTGPTVSTDRLFTVTQNGGAIYASGGLTFSNHGAIAMTGTGNRTLSLGGDTTSVCTFNSSIGDPAAGQTSLTKDRSATWVLPSSAVLTYSGDTDINMGTLTIGSGETLPFGAGKGNVVFGTGTDFNSAYPATLELNGNDLNINGLSGGVPATTYSVVDNNSGNHTLTVGNNNVTADFAGILTGNLNLLKVGTGTQTLDGANTNTGSTTVNAGELIFSATSTIGGTGPNVFINNGAILGAPGTSVTQTFANRIATTSTGVLALTSSDTNPLDFSAAGANLPNVSLGATTPVTFSGTLTAGAGGYKLGGGGGALTITTALTGANTLSVANPGTVILIATDSYSGATTISVGTLQFNTAASIGGTGASVTVNSGAIVAAGYAMDQPFLTRIAPASTGTVALAASSANPLDLSAFGANLPSISIGAIGAVTYSGTITPAGNYIFGGGGGTLVLSTANTLTGARNVTVGLGASAPASAANPLTLSVTAAQNYTGITTIKTGGTISGTVNNGGTAGAVGSSSNIASNLVLDGGTLAAIGTTDRLFTLTANGGTLDNSGGIAFTNTGAIALPTSSVTLTLTGSNTGHEDLAAALANPASGATTVIKTGVGKWTFNTANNKTYSGDTDVNAGTLETLAANAYSPNSNMVIASGAMLDFHANSQTINALSGAGAVNDSFGTSQTFTIGSANGSGSFSGAINGPVNVIKTGSGSQILTGANTYTNATTVSAGSLTIDYGGSVASTTFSDAANSTLNINGTIPSAAITSNGTTNFGANASIGLLARTLSNLTINNGGKTTVAAPTSSASRTVLSTSTLAFGGSLNNWQGKLDLTSNDMIVHGGSVTNITNQIKQGRNPTGVAWNGSAGITSSSAAATPATTALAVELNNNGSGGTLFTSFDNQTVVNTDVLVKYTFAGDADLSGSINASDYTLIDNGFNSGPATWRNGDFNYDGLINGDDYTLIDNAFNTQGSVSFAVISAGQESPTAMIASVAEQISDVGPPSQAVPEPSAVGLLAMAGILHRRRRKPQF